MSPFLTSVAKIEGKSFDLSAFRSDNEPFVKIVEKGAKKTRWMSISTAMARWMCEILGAPVARVSRSVMRKRFGRAIGWVKTRSNNKGWFVELGFSFQGKSAAIFVPGRRNGEPWARFREALEKVLDRHPDAPPAHQPTGTHGSRSYRDVTLGLRSCSTCGRPWENSPGNGAGGRRTANRSVAAARGPTRPPEPMEPLCTGRDSEGRPWMTGSTPHATGIEAQRNEHPTPTSAREPSIALPCLDRVRDNSSGLHLSFSGSTINISLDVGQLLSSVLQNIQQALIQGFSGVGQSMMPQAQVMTDSPTHEEQVQHATIQEEQLCHGNQDQGLGLPTQSELGNDMATKLDSAPSQEASQEAGVLDVGGNTCPAVSAQQGSPNQALDREMDFYGSEETSSFGDSSCDLRDSFDEEDWVSHVPESPSVDLQGVTLFNEEVTGLTTSETHPPSADVDRMEPAIEATPAKGDGILPTPASHFTLGSKEADDRGNNLMKAMGIQLVDTMGKEIDLGTKTYSRRKGCRELENLKTSINYDGRGLRKGFLNRI